MKSSEPSEPSVLSGLRELVVSQRGRKKQLHILRPFSEGCARETCCGLVLGRSLKHFQHTTGVPPNFAGTPFDVVCQKRGCASLKRPYPDGPGASSGTPSVGDGSSSSSSSAD